MTERGRSATSAAISTPRFIGPGCITMRRRGATGSLPRQPEGRGVLPEGRKKRPLPLVLGSGGCRHVDLGQHASMSCETVDRPALERRGSNCRWRDQSHLGAESGERKDVRARDPAVADITDDARTLRPADPLPVVSAGPALVSEMMAHCNSRGAPGWDARGSRLQR